MANLSKSSSMARTIITTAVAMGAGAALLYGIQVGQVAKANREQVFKCAGFEPNARLDPTQIYAGSLKCAKANNYNSAVVLSLLSYAYNEYDKWRVPQGTFSKNYSYDHFKRDLDPQEQKIFTKVAQGFVTEGRNGLCAWLRKQGKPDYEPHYLGAENPWYRETEESEQSAWEWILENKVNCSALKGVE